MKIVLQIENIYGVPNWEVIDLCKEYGPCQVNIRDKNAWCYAEYENANDAEYALEQLDGFAFGNGKLKVKIHRKIYDRKACFNFERDGNCRFGDDCRFLHNEVPKIAKVAKKEKVEPKKAVRNSKPEADYFRKALGVFTKKELAEKP